MIYIIELAPQDVAGLALMISYLITTIIFRVQREKEHKHSLNFQKMYSEFNTGKQSVQNVLKKKCGICTNALNPVWLFTRWLLFCSDLSRRLTFNGWQISIWCEKCLVQIDEDQGIKCKWSLQWTLWFCLLAVYFIFVQFLTSLSATYNPQLLHLSQYLFKTWNWRIFYIKTVL